MAVPPNIKELLINYFTENEIVVEESFIDGIVSILNSANLLAVLKENLKITWNDEDTNLEKILSRGKAYIQGLTGTSLNFDADGEANTLLLEYARYDYNKAIEYFEENFGSRLARLQYTEEIKEYQAAHPEEGA